MKVDVDSWYTGLGQVALAFFGGLIGALMRREASNWQTALLAACGAGFVGFLVAKFCRATGVSEDLTYAFVGVSGWLGAARTIDYLERLIEARLGTRFPHRWSSGNDAHKKHGNGSNVTASDEHGAGTKD